MMQKNGLRSTSGRLLPTGRKKGQQIIAQGIALGNIEAIKGVHTHNFTNLFFEHY